ncbi:MAG: ABC transporter ATP-binding protein [Candidatus Dormibacter sp.]
MSADVASERPAALLQATDIVAGYGGAPIINGISVTVGAGEVVSIVGPNGCGKSTLLKSLVGNLDIISGTVVVDGNDITRLASAEVARVGVGYVPQVDDVFEPLTVRENLEIGAYLLKRSEIPARLEHVVSVFPALAPMLSRRAGKLSGGERKMLAMGRVLMLQPKLFLLDEPTANLAPAIADSLLSGRVRSLASTGAGVLLVEQRAKAALAISSYTYVLSGGLCRVEGTPTKLSESSDFVESFLGGTVAQLPV